MILTIKTAARARERKSRKPLLQLKVFYIICIGIAVGCLFSNNWNTGNLLHELVISDGSKDSDKDLVVVGKEDDEMTKITIRNTNSTVSMQPTKVALQNNQKSGGDDEESNNQTGTSLSSWMLTPEQQDPDKPRLEFLHIQKNAGTHMEVLALQHGLTWGACHFDFPWKHNRMNPLKNCPPIRNTPVNRNVLWHYPLQHLPERKSPIQNVKGVGDSSDRNETIHNNNNYDLYYDNNDDLVYTARPKKYFAIVRNPYTRLISLFYMNNSDLKRKHDPDHHKDRLNSYVRSVIDNPQLVGLNYPNATICQYQYFYNDENEYGGDGSSSNNKKNNKMVDHILHFESLADDFNELVREYGLPSTMLFPSTNESSQNKVNSRMFKALVNYESFDDDTIKMINEACPKDFDIGRGYPKIDR